MKTCFIINARSGRAAKALAAVRTFAASRGAELLLTERRGHGAELAAAAARDGYELIVAVGGDGTMNEVASRVMGTGAILGLIPCGSGDGLGRHLGIHGSVPHALDILASGESRWIDSGLADGHPFFTAAGIGFEAEIAQRFNGLQRRGLIGYLKTSSRAWREWQPQSYTIVTERGRETIRAFTLAVANANQYGNDAKIAPEARVDDGKLNLTAVPPLGLFNALSLAARLFRGRITDARGIVMRVGAKFVIERERAGLLHTDGEVRDAGRTVVFEVRPASLRVMAPR